MIGGGGTSIGRSAPVGAAFLIASASRIGQAVMSDRLHITNLAELMSVYRPGSSSPSARQEYNDRVCQIGLVASTPFIRWDQMSPSQRNCLEDRAEQFGREATEIKLTYNLEPRYSPSRSTAGRAATGGRMAAQLAPLRPQQSAIAKDPQHWRERADEGRRIAEGIRDTSGKRSMLLLAEAFDRLAESAEQQTAAKG
jgi:hypothetical protein